MYHEISALSSSPGKYTKYYLPGLCYVAALLVGKQHGALDFMGWKENLDSNGETFWTESASEILYLIFRSLTLLEVALENGFRSFERKDEEKYSNIVLLKVILRAKAKVLFYSAEKTASLII